MWLVGSVGGYFSLSSCGVCFLCFFHVWPVLKCGLRPGPTPVPHSDFRSEDTKDFKELQKEYEAGYGVGAPNRTRAVQQRRDRDRRDRCDRWFWGNPFWG